MRRRVAGVADVAGAEGGMDVTTDSDSTGAEHG